MISESEMVDIAIRHFSRLGYKVSTEVPFLHRSIDLVYEDHKKIVSIEFKKYDWKRAITQAKTHIYGCSEVYICILKPTKGVSNDLIDYLKNTHIGLLLFDEKNKKMPIQKFLSASIKHKKWEVGEKWLKEAFYKRLGENPCLQN